MDRNGDFLFEPIMTEKNIRTQDLDFVNELAESKDKTTPLIVLFGFDRGSGWFGSHTNNVGATGIAQIGGICWPGKRVSITEIRNDVSLLGIFGTTIDIETTARVSVSSI